MFYKKSCSLKFRNTTASEKKIDRKSQDFNFQRRGFGKRDNTRAPNLLATVDKLFERV